MRGYSRPNSGLKCAGSGKRPRRAHRVKQVRGTRDGHVHVARHAGPPTTGDTAIVTNGGSVLLGDSLYNSWTLGSGLLLFAGNSLISFGTPDIPSTATITTTTNLDSAASTINDFGNYVNA